MSAYAWNKRTYISDIFVIVNFGYTSKKRINPNAKENEKNMVENIFKFLNNGGLERIGDYCW